MKEYLDFECFSSGIIISSNYKGFLEDLTTKLNNDLEDWELVKVPIKHEMIDDLTEIIKYEYRYRLYLSKVYELLGFDVHIATRYNGYYWEKDLEGNYTNHHLP